MRGIWGGPASIAFGQFELEEYTDTTNTYDIPVTLDSLDFSFFDFCDIPAPPAPITLSVATNRPVSSFFWENGSPYPTILAELGEKHAVKVSDGICSATDSVLVKSFTPSPAFCHAKIYFPNVFSPNGDGLNDSFGPQGADFEAIKLSVFDRWGNLWFEGPGNWPADRAHNGVYTFRFEYRNLF